jgi:hypothetical protein
MNWIFRSLTVALLTLLIIPSAVRAQQIVGVKAGILQSIKGEVYLEGKRLKLPQNGHIQMENGQRLTTRQGYVELLMSPGAYLRLGEDSSVRMDENQLGKTQIALEQGSALIEVIQKIEGNRITLAIAASVVDIEKAGLYRLYALPGELRVYRGEAVVVKQGKTALAKSGRAIHFARGLAVRKFDADVADSLHSWAARRSFDLFILTPETRKQTHWTPVSAGWLRNSAYRVSYYSEIFYLQWVKEEANRKIQELLAKYSRDQETRTIYGAEYDLLVAQIKEAQRAIEEAEARAKQAVQSRIEENEDSGQPTGTAITVPTKYAATGRPISIELRR